MTIDRVARPIDVGMLLFRLVVVKSSRNDGFIPLPSLSLFLSSLPFSRFFWRWMTYPMETDRICHRSSNVNQGKSRQRELK